MDPDTGRIKGRHEGRALLNEATVMWESELETLILEVEGG